MHTSNAQRTHRVFTVLRSLPVLLLLITGCAPSLVYDPSLHLPSRAVERNGGQVGANYTFFPETRPSPAGGTTVPGLGFTLRYAPSSSVMLGARGWGTFSENYDDVDTNIHFRGGASVETILPIASDKDKPVTALIPRVGIALDGGDVQGYGISVAFAYWLPSSGALTSYVGAGPILGFRDFSVDPAQWGYGLTGHLGTSLRISEGFSAHLEVTGVVQVNPYDDITHGILVPSLGIDWNF